jgi:peptidoglycan hydrolase-like protein with peptidoglycan-binding domain
MMKTRIIVLLSSLLWLGPLIGMAGEARRPNTPPPAQGHILNSGDILLLQQRLGEFNFNPGPVDGVWRDQTETALRTFQGQYGLPVTGMLDDATRKALQLTLPGGGATGTGG